MNGFYFFYYNLKWKRNGFLYMFLYVMREQVGEFFGRVCKGYIVNIYLYIILEGYFFNLVVCNFFLVCIYIGYLYMNRYLLVLVKLLKRRKTLE